MIVDLLKLTEKILDIFLNWDYYFGNQQLDEHLDDIEKRLLKIEHQLKDGKK